MEKNIDRLKFLLFRELAAKINSPFEMDSVLQEALDNSLEIVDLVCAYIVLWDEKTKKVKNEVASGSVDKHNVLREFDHQVIRQMRNKFSAESIYVTFDMGGPHSILSYPVRVEKQIVGAITGVSIGHRNLSK